MRRTLLAVLLAGASAILAAGCGGGGVSATGEGAAGIVPGSAPVYVALNTDFEGEQIGQARDLLDKFPGGDGVLHMLESQLEADGDVDFQNDVKPALGPELDIVLLDLPENGADPDVLALLKPNDGAKLNALVEQQPEAGRPVTEEVDGWTVLAETQAVIDRFKQARGGRSLDETDGFKNAMDGLPEDTLARVYVDGEALTRAASAGSPLQGRQLEQLVPGGIPSFGGAATAEEAGLRIDLAATSSQDTETFEPSLPAELPAGALAYVGFGDVAKGIRKSLNAAGEQNPQLDQQLAQLELALGVSLDKDVLPLFQNETAIAVYPAAAGQTPGFLLALKVDDEQGAARTVDRLLERASQFVPNVPQPRSTQAGGVTAKQVTLPDGTNVVYAGVDGKLVVTTDPELLGKLGSGTTLADDEAFKSAQSSAGVPDEVQTLVYLNLDQGAAYALDLAESGGDQVPPQVRENVEPLTSFVLYATKDGDRTKASGFLAID